MTDVVVILEYVSTLVCLCDELVVVVDACVSVTECFEVRKLVSISVERSVELTVLVVVAVP